MISVTTVLPVSPAYIDWMVKAPALAKVPTDPNTTDGAVTESMAPKTDRPVPKAALFATALSANGSCTVEPSTNAYTDPTSVPILHDAGAAVTLKVEEETIVALVASGATAVTENTMTPDAGGVVDTAYERTTTTKDDGDGWSNAPTVPYPTPDVSTTCTALMAVGLMLLPTSPPTNVNTTLLVLPAPQIERALPDVSAPYTAPNASVVIALSGAVIPLVPANWTEAKSDVGRA